MANFIKFTCYVPCQYFPAHGRLPPKILFSFSSNCDTQPMLLMLPKYIGSIHTHTFLKCSPWCPPNLLASLQHKKLVKIAKHTTTHQVLWTKSSILALSFLVIIKAKDKLWLTELLLSSRVGDIVS